MKGVGDEVGLTDSRLRPDQRLMEAGRWDEANSEKQRAVRRRSYWRLLGGDCRDRTQQTLLILVTLLKSNTV